MINAFSAKPLSVATTQIATSALLLQTYSQAISNQPNVTLSAVAGFAGSQKSLQVSALYCLTDIVPPLISLSAQDIGFGNQFTQLYANLLTKAQIIENLSTDNVTRQATITSFCKGINSLNHIIGLGKSSRNLNILRLSQFITLITSNKTDMDANMDVAQKQLLNGDVAELKAKLASIQQAIDADNQVIASGAIYGLIAGVKIAIGILVGWYEDPAEGFKIIVGEIEGIVEDSQKHSDAMDDLKAQNQAYLDALSTLLLDESVYAVVQNLDFNTNLLADHAQSTTLAIQAYSSAWQNLSDDLTNVITSLNDDDIGASLQLTESLTEALAEWNDLITQAKTIQTLGIVPYDIDAIH